MFHQQSQSETKFKSLSFDIMQQMQENFFKMAKGSFEQYQQGAKTEFSSQQKQFEKVIEPMQKTMAKLEEQQQALEKKREGAYQALQKQLELLMESEIKLRDETKQLVTALKSPYKGGAWGQVQLRRVVELAGMLHHCDFFEQASQITEGKLLRPDMVIKLPGNRQVIIDAKTPIGSYLEAMNTQDESIREEKLQNHTTHLKRHIKELSRKEYWTQFKPSPEYVILFLPAESFFSAALKVDPTLIEQSAHQNVLIATPTTLIAVLRAIAMSWHQEALSQNAKEIAELGKQLYERMIVLSDHWKRLGKSLSQSVDSYNQAISSFESRVLVSARKLKEKGTLNQTEIETLEGVDRICKTHTIDLKD